jgi:hypothetical protein
MCLGNDPELDPFIWEMRSSLDGQIWDLVAASWQVSSCAHSSTPTHSTKRTHSIKRDLVLWPPLGR